MLAGLTFLAIGLVLGTFLRLPAFMMVAVAILAGYGWFLRHQAFQAIGLDMLVALVAIQCGYALILVGRLAVKAASSRVRLDQTVDGIDRK